MIKASHINISLGSSSRRAKRCLIALLILAASDAFADDQTTVFLQGDEAIYMGEITGHGNRALFDLYEKEVPRPAWLSIRSKGGNIEAGMELGKWVHRNKIKVRIFEYCLSSCANYVFTAATEKVVSNFAIVGFHGGAASDTLKIKWPDDFDSLSPKQRNQMVEDTRRFLSGKAKEELDFYALLGVNPEISRMGQDRHIRARYAHMNDVLVWTYSPNSLSLLGIKDVRVINGPWKPQTLSGRRISFELPDDLVDERLKRYKFK